MLHIWCLVIHIGNVGDDGLLVSMVLMRCAVQKSEVMDLPFQHQPKHKDKENCAC